AYSSLPDAESAGRPRPQALGCAPYAQGSKGGAAFSPVANAAASARLPYVIDVTNRGFRSTKKWPFGMTAPPPIERGVACPRVAQQQAAGNPRMRPTINGR
ncbi:MAG: hypothetical protein ACRD25_11545, partial [Terracidiphilus sp.]